MEMVIRNKFEKAVNSLAKDNRFLAIMNYLSFIYINKLHDYEYENSRDALTQTGYKICLRELIEELELHMEDKQDNEDKW